MSPSATVFKFLMSSKRFPVRLMIGVVLAKTSFAPVFSIASTSFTKFSRYFSGVCRMCITPSNFASFEISAPLSLSMCVSQMPQLK